LTDARTTDHVRVAQGVLSREVQGEAVLLHLDSGEYFGLDAVATRIWQLLSETGDVRRAESAICKEFDVEPALAAKDVRDLVAQLLRMRLLEVPGPEGAA